MFRKKKKQFEVTPYDKTKERPIIRASICNGEQVAGFKSLEDSSFREVMFIRDNKDLYEFLERYAVDEKDLKKEY
jgi:hypothetical protein